MLKTVFFPKKEEPFYRKAIVADVDVPWFLSKGAVADGNKAIDIGMGDTTRKDEDESEGTPKS